MTHSIWLLLLLVALFTLVNSRSIRQVPNGYSGGPPPHSLLPNGYYGQPYAYQAPYGYGYQAPPPVFSPPGSYYDSVYGVYKPFPGGGIPVRIDYNNRCSKNYLGIKPHPDQQEYYYVCQPNCVIFSKCPKLESFNSNSGRCVHRVQPQAPPCVKEGRFAHPSDCRVYYRCDKNESLPWLFGCPSGTIFSPLKRKCIPGDECPSTEISNSGSYIPVNCEIKFPECTEEGTFRSPTDCALYYTCKLQESGNYLQTRFKCPGSNSYDPRRRLCRPRSEVSCHDYVPVPQVAYPQLPHFYPYPAPPTLYEEDDYDTASGTKEQANEQPMLNSKMVEKPSVNVVVLPTTTTTTAAPPSYPSYEYSPYQYGSQPAAESLVEEESANIRSKPSVNIVVPPTTPKYSSKGTTKYQYKRYTYSTAKINEVTEAPEQMGTLKALKGQLSERIVILPTSTTPDATSKSTTVKRESSTEAPTVPTSPPHCVPPATTSSTAEPVTATTTITTTQKPSTTTTVDTTTTPKSTTVGSTTVKPASTVTTPKTTTVTTTTPKTTVTTPKTTTVTTTTTKTTVTTPKTTTVTTTTPKTTVTTPKTTTVTTTTPKTTVTTPKTTTVTTTTTKTTVTTPKTTTVTTTTPKTTVTTPKTTTVTTTTPKTTVTTPKTTTVTTTTPKTTVTTPKTTTVTATTPKTTVTTPKSTTVTATTPKTTVTTPKTTTVTATTPKTTETTPKSTTVTATTPKTTETTPKSTTVTATTPKTTVTTPKTTTVTATTPKTTETTPKSTTVTATTPKTTVTTPKSTTVTATTPKTTVTTPKSTTVTATTPKTTVTTPKTTTVTATTPRTTVTTPKSTTVTATTPKTTVTTPKTTTVTATTPKTTVTTPKSTTVTATTPKTTVTTPKTTTVTATTPKTTTVTTAPPEPTTTTPKTSTITTTTPETTVTTPKSTTITSTTQQQTTTTPKSSTITSTTQILSTTTPKSTTLSTSTEQTTSTTLKSTTITSTTAKPTTTTPQPTTSSTTTQQTTTTPKTSTISTTTSKPTTSTTASSSTSPQASSSTTLTATTTTAKSTTEDVPITSTAAISTPTTTPAGEQTTVTKPACPDHGTTEDTKTQNIACTQQQQTQLQELQEQEQETPKRQPELTNTNTNSESSINKNLLVREKGLQEHVVAHNFVSSELNLDYMDDAPLPEDGQAEVDKFTTEDPRTKKSAMSTLAAAHLLEKLFHVISTPAPTTTRTPTPGVTLAQMARHNLATSKPFMAESLRLSIKQLASTQKRSIHEQNPPVNSTKEEPEDSEYYDGDSSENYADEANEVVEQQTTKPMASTTAAAVSPSLEQEPIEATSTTTSRPLPVPSSTTTAKPNAPMAGDSEYGDNSLDSDYVNNESPASVSELENEVLAESKSLDTEAQKLMLLRLLKEKLTHPEENKMSIPSTESPQKSLLMSLLRNKLGQSEETQTSTTTTETPQKSFVMTLLKERLSHRQETNSQKQDNSFLNSVLSAEEIERDPVSISTAAPQTTTATAAPEISTSTSTAVPQTSSSTSTSTSTPVPEETTIGASHLLARNSSSLSSEYYDDEDYKEYDSPSDGESTGQVNATEGSIEGKQEMIEQRPGTAKRHSIPPVPLEASSASSFENELTLNWNDMQAMAEADGFQLGANHFDISTASSIKQIRPPQGLSALTTEGPSTTQKTTETLALAASTTPTINATPTTATTTESTTTLTPTTSRRPTAVVATAEEAAATAATAARHKEVLRVNSKPWLLEAQNQTVHLTPISIATAPSGSPVSPDVNRSFHSLVSNPGDYATEKVPELILKVFEPIDLKIVFCPKSCDEDHDHTFDPADNYKKSNCSGSCDDDQPPAHHSVDLKWKPLTLKDTASFQTIT